MHVAYKTQTHKKEKQSWIKMQQRQDLGGKKDEVGEREEEGGI